MLGRSTLSLSALVVANSVAVAGEVQDCRIARSPDVRLAACNKVVDGSQFSKEDKALAYRMRGTLRSDAGAVADAIADFSHALELAPETAASYAGRGLARLTAGDQAGALLDYDAAVRLAPKQVAYRITRGHIRLASGNADGAIADLNDAISLDPKSAVALNNRGLAWRRKGDLAKAEADYTAAIQLNPIYAQAYANRGYLHEAMGRKADAVWDLQQALLLDSSLSEAKEVLKRLGGADASAAEADRRIERGRQLAEANCARCHAIGKDGASSNPKSPEFRNLRNRHPQLALRQPLTRGILAKHDEMPRFPLTDADIDAIVAYISSL